MGQLLPALPGFLMGGVSLVFHQYPEQAFVAWCTQYWWVVFAPGALITLAMSALIHLVPQRCPACCIALHQVGIIPAVLVSKKSFVRFCAHCGADFHESEPRSKRSEDMAPRSKR